MRAPVATPPLDHHEEDDSTPRNDSRTRPHIVLVMPRGEAIRNFIYSDTLGVLTRWARVTVLSVVDPVVFQDRVPPSTTVIRIAHYEEHRTVHAVRSILHAAHFRWLWSEVAKNKWARHDRRAVGSLAKLRRAVWKAGIRILAYRPVLRALGAMERYLTWRLRPTKDLDRLFEELQPDLVFNGSHIHGEAGELPLKVAHRLGIRTAGFIFSWDNLTSRSRIFVPYDDILVWNGKMADQLLGIYPELPRSSIHITGTPQFDFHLKSEFWLSRQDLCEMVGIDPARPFVLYTTGIDRHFPEEHKTLKLVAELLESFDLSPAPQLVVRTYVKGTSPEMRTFVESPSSGVVFAPMKWNESWVMPEFDDLALYTSLLRHTALGINAASTVSLELLMHDKPVINLGFDPPGSDLHPALGFRRHIDFDHYRPLAESGAVVVASSPEDMRLILHRGLTKPEEGSEKRRAFIREMFGDLVDGLAGERVAERLLILSDTTQSVARSA